MKAYVCNRYPSLKLSVPGSADVEFRYGSFVAQNDEESAAVEGSSFYGVHIFPKDVEEEAPKKARKKDAPEVG